MTQQELFAALIREALARRDEFVETVFKLNAPMPDREYGKILSPVEDWGVQTGWEEIDQQLYGTRKQWSR